MKFVENQMLYNSKKMDALDGGLGALVDADLAKESSVLEALKVRVRTQVEASRLSDATAFTLGVEAALLQCKPRPVKG